MKRSPNGRPSKPGDRSRASFGRRLYLTLELTAVFLVFPLSLYTVRFALPRWIIPMLLAIALVCLMVLLADPEFDRRRLWNRRELAKHLWRSVSIFVPLAVLLALLVAVFEPRLLLQFPRQRPWLWAAVMVLYPVLSVYPQELIFRTFFFHRYHLLFPDPRVMIAMSGAAFGVAHLFFANWVAPLLSTLGGVLFAITYQRSRSTLQACLEHSLWGDYLFTLGLGWYFYGGSVGSLLEG